MTSLKTKEGNVIWFNPPYNYTITTNIGRNFLRLIDECFPPGHKLRKAFNRNCVKVSYSGTPNMEKIISSKNSKTLRQNNQESKTCSCTKDKECPLGGKCLTNNLVYQATIEVPNKQPKTYIGQTSTNFKARLATHTHSFKQTEENQTALSHYHWELKNKGLNPKITWKIIDRGPKFSPSSGVCLLCIKEAYYITFHPEMAALNSNCEIFSSCRHKKSTLLIKKPRGRKRKKPPGT